MTPESWSARRTGSISPKRALNHQRQSATDATGSPFMTARALYDKIWQDHLVDEQPDGTCLIYIDRHLVHEVTSPQAFEGLRLAGRKVHAPDKTLLVVDHNVPTTDRSKPNPDPESAAQIAYLAENAKLFGLEYFDEFDKRQGIVHIIGPEQGFTLPGTTIVCGDSHTATHGAFGGLAYGIGTSEVEHVLATQTLYQKKSKNMRAVIDGKLPHGVTAKDIILAIIGEIGTAGGTGYAIEYAGEAISALSMEGRMTVCNMSVEGGAKAGFIAPDDKVYAYLKDLRAAAKVVDGKTVSSHVNGMIVPGSGIVKEQAEAEGLDKIFLNAGFEWREPGCSMCLAMNPDKLKPGERCASTSNRNFEGRQGYKGRTHLVSPAIAAAAAVAGKFVDVRAWR